jgi:hypothetical protein
LEGVRDQETNQLPQQRLLRSVRRDETILTGPPRIPELGGKDIEISIVLQQLGQLSRVIVSRTRRECARRVRKKGILIQMKVCSYVILISFSFTVSLMISRIHGAGVRYLLSYTIIALSAIANPNRKEIVPCRPGCRSCLPILVKSIALHLIYE